MTLHLFLLILAFVLFLLATFNVPSKVNLTAAGLAAWMATMLFMLLLSVVPASAQHDSRWLHGAIGASMVAHGADLSATSFALGRGGFREANPLLRPFAGDPVTLAIAKMGTAVAINYGLLKFHTKHPKTVLAIAVAQTIAIAYVAHRNAELVR